MSDTETEVKTSSWFAGRFSRRIDHLWLGGLLLINIAVWLLLGAKYIGLALIAYYFIFVMTLREQIKAVYPATISMYSSSFRA